MVRTLLRRTTGVTLLLLALPLALGAGALAFLGTALATATIPLLAAAGLAALTGTAFLVAWPAFALLSARRTTAARAAVAASGGSTARPARAAAVLAGVLAVAVAGLATVTVFRPLPTATTAADPAGTRYWDLPTGSRLAYTVEPARGTRRPAPVIVLHGGPGTPGDGIDDTDRALAADGFDVYEYDQLGAGRSTRLADPEGYTVARHVADLEAVRQAIGAERVILMGASWGATLAAYYLAAHPDRVARVVFTSPGALWEGAFPDGQTGDIWDKLTPAQEDEIDALAYRPRFLAATLLQGVNPRAARALLTDPEADRMLRQILEIAAPAAQYPGAPPLTAPANAPGFWANQFTSLDAETVADPRPALRAVHVPALVLRAEADYKKWAVTYDYKRTLPEATLVYVKGAGHAISSDKPALYLSLLRAFLLDRALPLPAWNSADPPR